MKTIFVLFLIILSLIFGAKAQKFCEDKTPLDSIFTIGSMTYARKGDNFFRTTVGRQLGKSQEKGKYKDFLFKTDINGMKFLSIDTGFMVTKLPKCDTKSYAYGCQQLLKAKDLAFIMGKSTLNDFSYKTYRLEKIGNATDISALVPMTSPGDMPFGLAIEGKIDPRFWPTNKTDFIYLHSTFDEKTLSIIHLVISPLPVEVLYLFILPLDQVYSTIHYDSYNLRKNLMELRDINEIKGFFHMTGTNADTNNVFAIGRHLEKERLLTMNHHFEFINESSLSLDDIYGCPQEVTISSIANTTEATSVSPLNITEQTSGEISVTSPDQTLSSSDNSTLVTTPESSSNSWIWIIVIAVVCAIIVLVIVIWAYLSLRGKE